MNGSIVQYSFLACICAQIGASTASAGIPPLEFKLPTHTVRLTGNSVEIQVTDAKSAELLRRSLQGGKFEYASESENERLSVSCADRKCLLRYKRIEGSETPLDRFVWTSGGEHVGIQLSTQPLEEALYQLIPGESTPHSSWDFEDKELDIPGVLSISCAKRASAEYNPYSCFLRAEIRPAR